MFRLKLAQLLQDPYKTRHSRELIHIYPPQSTDPSRLTQEERVKIAEQFKTEGNQFLAAKEYEKAVQCYSKAIEANPASAIYYSNR